MYMIIKLLSEYEVLPKIMENNVPLCFNKSYRHAVYDYNNVSLTVDLPVTAKMLKDFIFKSI